MWTITSIADAIWRWIADRQFGAHQHQQFQPLNHLLALLAWIVVIEPLWPVFIACTMSSASPPRHSPTTMRSGRIRRAFLTKSRIV
jgi:hypothetical protein